MSCTLQNCNVSSYRGATSALLLHSWERFWIPQRDSMERAKHQKCRPRLGGMSCVNMLARSDGWCGSSHTSLMCSSSLKTILLAFSSKCLCTVPVRSAPVCGRSWACLAAAAERPRTDRERDWKTASSTGQVGRVCLCWALGPYTQPALQCVCTSKSQFELYITSGKKKNAPITVSSTNKSDWCTFKLLEFDWF